MKLSGNQKRQNNENTETNLRFQNNHKPFNSTHNNVVLKANSETMVFIL